MNSQDDHSIAGGWLGTYWYRGTAQGQPPCRFEATFSVPGHDGRFTGSILDDGPLGAATVTGTQEGARVRFTKQYALSATGMLEVQPVEYEGTLSEDGKSMRGTWRIEPPALGRARARRTRGGWEAHRAWSEAAEPEAQPEEQTETLKALVPLGACVRSPAEARG